MGEWVLFRRDCHVAPLYFYSSPEWTNQALALYRTFYIFTSPEDDRRFCYTPVKGRVRGGVFIGLESATSLLDAINPTHWSLRY